MRDRIVNELANLIIKRVFREYAESALNSALEGVEEIWKDIN